MSQKAILIIDGKRSCFRCKEMKDLCDFANDKQSKTGKKPWCKPCEKNYRELHKDKLAASRKSWWSKNKKEHQWNVRKYTYKALGLNITKEQYVDLYEKQAGKCAICGKEDDSEKTHCLDHCHATNKIRGFLCHKCNRGLGMFADNFELLEKAIEYLKENG